MFKKIIFIFFVFLVIYLVRENNSNILQVLKTIEDKTVELDNQYRDYHINYDNLTTNNILDELSFLEGLDDIKIVVITELANESIEYNINSKNLKKELGEFFNYCISKLEDKYLDDEIVKAYSSGIRVQKLIITMSKVLANNYLQYNKDLKYEIR